MPEVVYVLINRAMPGIVKIGRTDDQIESRMKALDNTSVPLPFECHAAWEVENAAIAEKALHDAFGDHRVRDRREFFRIGEDKPTAILKAFGHNDVTPADDVVGDEDPSDDRKALDRARSRRPNFRFDMLGIRPGETLHSLFDQDITCTVHDNKKVLFRGEVMSLSNAALVVAREQGKTWNTIAGTGYWKYDEQTLWELREQEESDDE